jgi:hypothetical protein
MEKARRIKDMANDHEADEGSRRYEHVRGWASEVAEGTEGRVRERTLWGEQAPPVQAAAS